MQFLYSMNPDTDSRTTPNISISVTFAVIQRACIGMFNCSK